MTVLQPSLPDLVEVMRAKHHQTMAAGADGIVNVNEIETEAKETVNGEGIGTVIVTANASVVPTRTVREGTAIASIEKAEIGSGTEEIVTVRERLAIKKMSERGSGRGVAEWQVPLPVALGIILDVIVEGVIVLGRGDMANPLAGGEVVLTTKRSGIGRGGREGREIEIETVSTVRGIMVEESGIGNEREKETESGIGRGEVTVSVREEEYLGEIEIESVKGKGSERGSPVKESLEIGAVNTREERLGV